MTDENPGELPPESPHWEVVLRAWEGLDLPEGWRAEIIEGAIVLRGFQTNEHAGIVSQIQEQIIEETVRSGSLLNEAHAYQNIDIRLPAHNSLCIPDLVVLPESVKFRRPEHAAEEAILVVEVTSEGTRKRDHGPKRSSYAHGGAALYLLVDRWDNEFTNSGVYLFSHPEDGHYRGLTKVPFGNTIHLPEPFDLTLDTSEFPA